MRTRMIVSLAAAAAVLGACGQGRAEEPGPTVSRNYNVGNFQEIEVAGSYDVTVRTGGNPAVAAAGPQKLLEHTIVEVRDGKLVIRPEERHGFSGFHFGSHDGAKFTVTVPQLRAAATAGSGDIHIDQVRGDAFSGSVGGSGGIELGKVEVKTLNFAIGGSGSVKASSGTAQTAQYDIGGSGEIEAAGVQAQQAQISIAGSGSVEANAKSTAEVSVMGSGDASVTGGAKCNVTKAGSGSVSCP